MIVKPQAHWLARGIGSATTAPLLLLAIVGVTLWLLERSTQPVKQSALLILAALLVVAAGCAALAWVRPERAGLSPPHVMLSLGFGGMLLGLLYDFFQNGPDRLGTLCAQSGNLDFIDSLRLHAEFLPGMHVGMLAGGLLAIPSLRSLRARAVLAVCTKPALFGMDAGWHDGRRPVAFTLANRQRRQHNRRHARWYVLRHDLGHGHQRGALPGLFFMA